MFSFASKQQQFLPRVVVAQPAAIMASHYLRMVRHLDVPAYLGRLPTIKLSWNCHLITASNPIILALSLELIRLYHYISLRYRQYRIELTLTVFTYTSEMYWFFLPTGLNNWCPYFWWLLSFFDVNWTQSLKVIKQEQKT